MGVVKREQQIKRIILSGENGGSNMYCIIHKSKGLDDVLYLAWQNPVWDFSGYFWTYKEVVKEILCNNTEEHPFLFRSRAEAIAHLKSINIPQKCSIVRWTA